MDRSLAAYRHAVALIILMVEVRMGNGGNADLAESMVMAVRKDARVPRVLKEKRNKEASFTGWSRIRSFGGCRYGPFKVVKVVADQGKKVQPRSEGSQGDLNSGWKKMGGTPNETKEENMFTDGIIPIDVSGAEPWVNSFEEGEEVVYRVEPGRRRTKVGVVTDHDDDGAPIVRRDRCRKSSPKIPSAVRRCRSGRCVSARGSARNRETCTHDGSRTGGGGGREGVDGDDDPPAGAPPRSQQTRSTIPPTPNRQKSGPMDDATGEAPGQNTRKQNKGMPRRSRVPSAKEPSANYNSPWLNAEQAWRYIKLPSIRALYQAIRRGSVPHYRYGRRLRFRKEELDTMLRNKPGWTIEDQRGIIFKTTPVCRKGGD